MGWREARTPVGRAARVAIAIASAGLAGGCFQPLYGEGAVAGSSSVRDALSTVSVEQIVAPAGTSDARIAVQLRNDLLFSFTGGGAAPPPTYRLKVTFSGSRQVIVVDQSAL